MELLNMQELHVLMDTLSHSLAFQNWHGGYDHATRTKIYDDIVNRMQKIPLTVNEKEIESCSKPSGGSSSDSQPPSANTTGK